MRAIVICSFCLLAGPMALAQVPAAPPVAADPPAAARTDKRIEHIRIEDKGARIDELRYGGEPQSITVQPRNSALPAYQIVPDNGARVRPGKERDAAPGNAGQRVWNVLDF